MCSLHLEIEEIKSSLKRMMRQPYVDQYITEPFIDQNKIMFLTDIYRYTNIWSEHKKEVIMAVMLVQSALDTHERVPSYNDLSMPETEKQLTVLSGDYYSGIYYALLAKHGQIQMIRVIAEAIKEINEYKMRLYYEEANDFNELIYILMKVESLLIVHVADALHIDSTYVQVVERLCLLNRLKQELTAVMKQEDTYVTAFLQKRTPHASIDQLAQTIKHEIVEQTTEVDQLLSQLPCSYATAHDEIRSTFNLSYHTTIAEEG